jgi:thiamine-monophosphate kinase
MTDAPALSEIAIIQRYLAPLAAGFAGAFGLTDDCASVAPPPGFDLVVKTDPIREGVHFLPADPPEALAWKALAVNISDLAAKGAKPFVYTMALCMPEPPTEAWLSRFTKGLGDAQATFGCHLIGGDTDRAPGPLSIAITALGLVPAGQMVRRGAARAGDVIYVSGTLGDAALGLSIASRDASVASWSLDDDARAFLADRYRRPQPRTGLSAALLAHASAAMDLSDGLHLDLSRMMTAASVGATIDLARLPLSEAARAAIAAQPSLRVRTWSGGDDYEILCTVSPDRGAAFEADAARAGIAVTAIGRVTTDRRLSFPGFEQDIAARPAGWQHF